MQDQKVTTGVPGLDSVLKGGLIADKVYLVQGKPGTGKTTMGLQFLLEGVKRGEKCLLISVFESRDAIRQAAASFGWSLDGIEIYEVTSAQLSQELVEQSVFYSADLELTERTQTIFEIIDKVGPDRFVFDSMAEIRMIADTALRYRRQMFALNNHLMKKHCTSLVLDYETDISREKDLQDLVNGVIVLEQASPEYGSVRSRLEIIKMRGMAFQTGYHNYRITDNGLAVYPRLKISNAVRFPTYELNKSGNDSMDTLLGGGLEAGTSCLILGPTGTGKSTIATLYAHAAAKRGQPSVFYLFEEMPDTYIHRSANLNMDIKPFVENGLITLNHINAGDITAAEFAANLKESIDTRQCKVVVIDSLAGYYNAMPSEFDILLNLHELLSYLNEKDVLTLLIMAQHGFLGQELHEAIAASYISDSILLIRYFESFGALHLALAAVKKRHGRHERTIREMRISAEGIQIGEPLKDFSAVLTGVPLYHGKSEQLMESGDHK